MPPSSHSATQPPIVARSAPQPLTVPPGPLRALGPYRACQPPTVPPSLLQSFQPPNSVPHSHPSCPCKTTSPPILPQFPPAAFRNLIHYRTTKSASESLNLLHPSQSHPAPSRAVLRLYFLQIECVNGINDCIMANRWR